MMGAVLSRQKSERIDTGEVNEKQALTVGLINGVVSFVAAPYAGLPSTIGELENGVIGGTTNAITSVVNELVFDSTSSIIMSEGGS